MSRRAEIQRHLGSLVEIDGIMRAMKNLSLMETHKLARFSAHQLQALSTIERALSEVSASGPVTPTQSAARAGVLLAIGSERGFCGDFNEALAQAIHSRRKEGTMQDEALIVVGARLLSRLGAERVSASFRGASVAEEVPEVLQRVVTALHEAVAGGERQAIQSLSVLAYLENGEKPVLRQVFPREPSPTEGKPGIAPVVMLMPLAALYRQLLQHHLWAVLHAAFYGSLMAENRKRLQHMERAINRLEERMQQLRRSSNLLRQEEITEEIEVIMLSRDALGSTPAAQRPGEKP